MKYTHIQPQDIFRYKALPREQWKRITALPSFVSLELPVLSGFPQVDAQAEKQARQAINWDELPERNHSDCQFINCFAALVHQYGFRRMDFYAEKMQAINPVAKPITPTELSTTLRVLTGLTGPEWVICYTQLMLRDLQARTNLKQIELAPLLNFISLESFSQFVRKYGR